jgi:hypothetical protein
MMRKADVVIGLGRSAMEGMASGRVVLVLDARSYTPFAMDGLVTPENVWPALECNLSGRRFQLPATEESVADALAGYDRDLGEFGCAFARVNLDVAQQVDSYLALADTLPR